MNLSASEICTASSGEDCVAQVVRLVTGAKGDITVEANSLTSKPLAKAFQGALQRGANVTALFDKAQRNQNFVPARILAKAGIPTYIDSNHIFGYNKIALLDSATILIGSFNRNKKDMDKLFLLKPNKMLLELYRDDFACHKRHSERYETM